MKDLIYIAGPINSDSCGTYKNVHKLTIKAQQVHKMGASVYNPANDLIQGVVCGDWEYTDYTKNDFPILHKCDAMYLTGDWEKSKGCLAEKKFAEEHNIPIFTNHWKVYDFINRPKILCIVGESGSGKTLIADYIEERYGIPMIRSYTTREKRNPEEDGHTFITDEDFDEIQYHEMVAYTKWGDVRYCCKHEDVQKMNTYVIDESGYSMLRSLYSKDYKVCGLKIHRDRILRSDVDNDRIGRDDNKFILYNGDFYYNVNNNSTKKDLMNKIDHVVEEFFYEKQIS